MRTLILAAALSVSATAQSAATEIRQLPASVQPPPDVVEEQNLQQRDRQVERPPARAGVEDLLQRVQSQPGGRERVDAARQGRIPGRADSPGIRAGELVDEVIDMVIPQAVAAAAFTVELTPKTDPTMGWHSSLFSRSPWASASVPAAWLGSGTPTNHYVTVSGNYSIPGLQHTISESFTRLTVEIPSAGWYLININARTLSGVQLRHWQNGSYALLQQYPQQSQLVWADYPTLQYLAAGWHSFYWTLNRGGMVSRWTVDSVTRLR